MGAGQKPSLRTPTIIQPDQSIKKRQNNPTRTSALQITLSARSDFGVSTAGETPKTPVKTQPNNSAGVSVLPIAILAGLISIAGILVAQSSRPTLNPSWPAATATSIAQQAIVVAGTSICDNQEKQSAPDDGNSPDSSDSASDIDDNDGGLDDFDSQISPQGKTLSQNKSLFQFAHFSIPRSSNPDPFRIYPREISKLWTISILVFFTLLICFWPFGASANPADGPRPAEGFGVTQTTSTTANGDTYSPTTGSNLDCMIAASEENQSAPDDGNSPDSSVSTSDLNDDDGGGLDDLSADTSGGFDQDTPLVPMIGLDPMILQKSPVLSILLVPVRSFFCLHQHLRERAPPILG